MNDHGPLQRARAAALRLLTYRPRTAAEVRGRLLRRFDAAVVAQVIDELSDQSLLDDIQFAHRWTEGRDSRSPRSATAIRRELVSRGVERTVAEQAVGDLDDEDSAYRAGLKHARRTAGTDLQTFQRRLRGYLQRRGYSYAITRRTIDRLWAEQGR